VAFDESRQLRRALALRMVAHAWPDLEVRLGQRGLHGLSVIERDERVARAPERRDRTREVD
jgi:hypothetical protein